MQRKKPRIAAISDRARLARLTRAELERLLVRAKRAFEAFGASAEDLENADGDNAEDNGARYNKKPPHSAPAAV